jgi:hypothetical protein
VKVSHLASCRKPPQPSQLDAHRPAHSSHACCNSQVLVKSHKPVAGTPAPTIAGTVSRVIKEDGFLSLYQGCVPEVSRGVLSAALMLAAKEKIAALVTKIVLARK